MRSELSHRRVPQSCLPNSCNAGLNDGIIVAFPRPSKMDRLVLPLSKLPASRRSMA